MGTARRIVILIGLLGLAAATFVPIGRLGDAYGGLPAPWGREILWWALAVVVLVYVLIVERRGLSSIGFKAPGLSDIALGVLAAGITAFGMGFIYAMVFPVLHLKPNTGTLTTLIETSLVYRLAIVTRAAFVEEIIFRGYGIERLKELTGRSWIAALVTMAAFTYAHFSGWGTAHLIPVAWAALVLSMFYLWRRNIWTVILAHWLTDALGIIVLPMLQG